MKYLRIVLCIALALAGSNLMAAPGLGSIQKKIANAGKLWDQDASKAQAMLREAFAEAIIWTKAEYVDRVREQGFYTAVTCLSPELLDEVSVAADTYVQLFPKGRNLKKVHLYRSMAAWAAKDFAAAEQAINEAVRVGNFSYPEQSQVLTSQLSSGKHRTAEKFIEGQRISRPSSKLKRDLKRFHSGNRLVEGLLNRVKEGKISGVKAAEMLESAVNTAWFAKRAPEASLTSISIKDAQAPYYNSIIIEWCGLERVVKHASSPQLRLLKLENFVNSFPEADDAEMFKALIDLRYLQNYEFRDAEAAKSAFDKMANLTSLAEKVEIETIVSNMTPEKLATEQGNDDLQRLIKLAGHLPYDNGHLPWVSKEYVEFMLAISDMILGRVSLVNTIAFTGWKKLPVNMLYQIASGKKEKAYEIYKSLKPSLSPQMSKMIEDLMMPLYLPITAKERTFLAGLAAVDSFPDLGTDLLIDAVSGHPRMYKAEHGLAVISDVYSNHMAFAEAQNVWSLLSKLFPDSIWLK